VKNTASDSPGMVHNQLQIDNFLYVGLKTPSLNLTSVILSLIRLDSFLDVNASDCEF